MRRHARRRDGEGGAAMFVVAMTLAVLASVGIYALAAASNEVRTSGNERQNTQTHYLAEYGVLGVTHEIVGSKAGFLSSLMTRNSDTCMSAPPPPPSVSIANATSPKVIGCRRIGSNELGTVWTGAPVTVPYGGQQAYQAGIGPGSLGPVPMAGDFFVEVTEKQPAPYAPGQQLSQGFCFIRLTLTSVGRTEPVIAGQTTGVYANLGLEVQRAHIIAGPTTECSN
jgi:Tfp pilus assembly protein PilX